MKGSPALCQGLAESLNIGGGQVGGCVYQLPWWGAGGFRSIFRQSTPLRDGTLRANRAGRERNKKKTAQVLARVSPFGFSVVSANHPVAGEL